MRKKLVKIALAIAVVATGSFSSYKAYRMYATENMENSLFIENVEALSQWAEGGFTLDGYACVHTPYINSSGLPTGKCFASAWRGGGYQTYHSHPAERCCSYK